MCITVSNKYGLQGSMHWSRLFTRMITAKTKLVGPTITCSNPPSVSVNDTMPYVQFNALATDQVCSLVSHLALCTLLPAAKPSILLVKISLDL